MKVTWLVPDTYGFLLDEIDALRGRVERLRVLSGSPISDDLRRRFENVEFYECPETQLRPWGRQSDLFRYLLGIHGWRRLLGSAWHTRKIAGMYSRLSELEKESPSDVIHSHFAHPGGLGGAFFRERPQLVTLRGYDILTTGSYGSLWNPFYRKNLIHHWAQSGTVTAGSRFSALRARQILGSEADIRCIPEGLAGTTFQAAGVHSRSSLGIPEGHRVLVSVGNLTGVKNSKLLLNAFAELTAKDQLHLVICGDGDMRGELQKLSGTLGGAEQVHFMGRLPREELTDIYQLADLFVHTSMSEGFGNVILEAMLHKLPVVASPVGVAADIIRHGENGWLPELGDLESLKESLLEALEQISDFQTQLENNREMVQEQFSMERRINGFMALYEEASSAGKRDGS